jgi:hypothetical protein
MVTFGARRIVVTALVLSWSLTRPIHASEPVAGVRHIRVLSPCVKTLIEDATTRSSTVRMLVDCIDQSDLIIYVRCVAFKNASLFGRLGFLTAVVGQRYVVIELRTPEQWNMQVATIAHELQHAVEIADARWVRNQATMAQYYRQHGIRIDAGPLVFDTEAARTTGLRVRRELSAVVAASGPEGDRHPQR